MLSRALRVLFVGALLVVVVVPACGNTSDTAPTTMGGSGGASGTTGGGIGGSGGASTSGTGGTSAAQTVACGSNSCKAVTLTIPGQPTLVISACCSDADSSTCGLDTTFLGMFGPTFPVACQPLAQAGTPDTSCPARIASIPNMPADTFPIAGCCRAGGTCGYDLNKLVGIFPIGLGCVDSAPFLDGGAPLSCGDSGMAGAGQGGGAGDSSTGAAGETATGGASD
ncbi:MAG TPA: hypothetical protein VK745_29960 [Polyangiaceae bacterium]|nr:hypothetical protein [Polyangiaceae bacterium]